MLLHVGGDVPPLDLRLALAAVAGLVATLGMTAVMRLQSHGYVPAYVAAAAVWRRPPEQVSRSAADAVHLAAGMAAGVLFEALDAGYERLRSAAGVDVEVVVAGVATLSEVAALAVVVAFLYAFFSSLVFPRFGGAAYETRTGTVRRQWAVSAVAYGVVLFAALQVVYAVVPA